MPHPGPSTVGRYELRSRLGAGGMGTVWRAWDPSLRRDVAIKEVLLPSGMTPQEQTEAHQRTLREAQATARINHTAVVTIHDVLEHDHNPWIVMELLNGQSLQTHLEQHGPMSPTQVEHTARALLGGLKAAHAAGVTHRDVKPANIMLTEDGRTVLTDFGIANVDGGTALTQTGVYIGSPEYMAPERFEGARALPASDLWSLGVTLYALLEGRSPFKRDSITGIISAVLTAPMPPEPLAQEHTPPTTESAPIRALIAALLNRDVEQRPDPDQALDLLERERETTRPSTPFPRHPRGHRRRRELPATHATPPRGIPPAVFHPTGGAHPFGAPFRTARHHTPHPTFGPPARTLRTASPAHSGPQASGATVRYTPTGSPTGGPPPATGYTSTTHQQLAHPPVSHTPPAPHTQHFTHPHNRTGPNTPPRPRAHRPLPDMPKPVPVVIAALMLGLNTLYLMVLTALLATDALTSGQTGWGATLFLGTWGLVSACAAVGLLARSRILYLLVLAMQGLGAIMLTFSMFTVFIYNPDQLVLYGLVLTFNLAIGALLLLPGRARAFYGFGTG